MSIINRKPITKTGYEILKKKLEHMVNIELPKAINDITVARGHGDFSENAELDSAKAHRDLLEDQINQIQNYLRFARPVKPRETADYATFGLRVHLECLTDPKQSQAYIIVGEREESIEKGSISASTQFVNIFLNQPIGFKFHNNHKEYIIKGVSIPTEEEIQEAIEVR